MLLHLLLLTMLLRLIRASFPSLDLLDPSIPPNKQTLGISHDHHGVLVHKRDIICIKLYISSPLQMHNFNLLSISIFPIGVL